MGRPRRRADWVILAFFIVFAIADLYFGWIGWAMAE